MNNFMQEVETWLGEGKISDETYAATLLDDARLIEFANNWLKTSSLRF